MLLVECLSLYWCDKHNENRKRGFPKEITLNTRDLTMETTTKDELSVTQKYPQHNCSTFQLTLCDVPLCSKN